MPDTSPERKHLRGQIASATRYGEHKRADLLRADLLALKIKELVDAAPPLTPEQRTRLAAIFTNPAPQPRARRR